MSATDKREGLVLHAVSVALDGRDVVRDLSCTLAPGAFVAIVGPNGAGKTSLLRALAGLVPARGTAAWNDTDLARLDAKARARLIAYLPQGHVVHWPMPARDVVALGRFPHGATDPARLSAADRIAVRAAMERTGCLDLGDRDVRLLSGGERARVMLARVLAVEAPVLLVDEPTAALDPRQQLSIMEALRAQARRGALVLAVTHDLTLAARMADRVLLLHEGRLVADGTPDVALSDATLAATYGVRALRLDHGGESVLVPWHALEPGR